MVVASAQINWSVVFGFIISGLIGVVWWTIQRGLSHAEKLRDKDEKEKEKIIDTIKLDRDLFDSKLEKVATLFSVQLKEAGVLFGSQIKEVGDGFMREVRDMKTAMDAMAREMNKLATTMVQIEKDSTVRYEAINKRFEDHSIEAGKKFDEHWKEIEKVRNWKHETDNHLTRLLLREKLDDQKATATEKETASIRQAAFDRIKAIEDSVEKLKPKKR